VKKIITYGTFDLFHFGHLRLLERAKALGDYLIVAVSTDEFNAIKGKQCTYPYEHRSQIVAAIKYVDEVIPEKNWEQKVEDVKKHNVDIFVMGCEVIYLERTKDISTTQLKYKIKNLSTK